MRYPSSSPTLRTSTTPRSRRLVSTLRTTSGGSSSCAAICSYASEPCCASSPRIDLLHRQGVFPLGARVYRPPLRSHSPSPAQATAKPVLSCGLRVLCQSPDARTQRAEPCGTARTLRSAGSPPSAPTPFRCDGSVRRCDRRPRAVRAGGRPERPRRRRRRERGRRANAPRLRRRR